MPAEAVAYIGLGSNLADPVVQVRSAMVALTQLPATRVEASSSLYGSTPVGSVDQPDFVNAACRVRTRLAPEELMRCLLDIERAHGRTRDGEKGGPRTLDLDLLLYGEERRDTPLLRLPHPRLHERAFVLTPLSEIDPALSIPGHGPVMELLRRCSGQRVEKLKS